MSDLSSYEKETLYGVFNCVTMQWVRAVRFNRRRILYTSNISEAKTFPTKEEAETYSQHLISLEPALKYTFDMKPITFQLRYY